MFLIVAIICGFLYCIKNFFAKEPPIVDYLSPMVTLSMAISLLISQSITGLSLALGLILILEAWADFHMGFDVRYPITVFSSGHVLKQIVIFYLHDGEGFLYLILIDISFILTGCLGVVTVQEYYDGIIINGRCYPVMVKEWNRISMLLYTGVMACTMIIMIIHHETIWIGFLLFIISDLLILFDDLFVFNHRQMRVILVPVLYWISQYLIVQDMLASVV